MHKEGLTLTPRSPLSSRMSELTGSEPAGQAKSVIYFEPAMLDIPPALFAEFAKPRDCILSDRQLPQYAGTKT
jgi:hypothetical protein